MKSARIIVVIITSLLCYVSNAQVYLGYKLECGSTFKIQQKSDQTILQHIDGFEQEIVNHLETIVEFKVLKERADGYEIAMQFKDIKMQVETAVMNETISTTEDNSIFKGLLNYPIKMVLKFNGDIANVSGCETLIERMMTAANIEDEFTRELMRASLEKDFGPKAISETYKQMTYFYPCEKVLINDSWHTVTSGISKMDNTWKLVSVDDRKAILSANGVVDMNLQKSGVTMKLSGSQKSYLVANAYTGLLQELTIEGIASGSSHIEMDEGGKNIPTTITSKIKYNLIN